MHVHGQTWYVGTCGITVVLVNTKAGLALFDSGPKEAAPLVLANVRALGFDPTRIKWIFSTHEHFDHGGGIAVLEKVTGARLAAGPFAAGALSTGKPYPDDPQFTLLTTMMLPARVDRVLADGGLVYRTHGLGYVYVRHSAGHTATVKDEHFLTKVTARHEGLIRHEAFGTQDGLTGWFGA